MHSPAGTLKASTRDRGLELELRADVDGAPGGVTRVALTGTGALETFDAPYAFSSAFDWKLIDELLPLGGVRIEDDVYCTADGYEDLTRRFIEV